MDVPEWASKDLGPFPVWGWGAVVGAGVGLGLVVRMVRSRRAPRDTITAPVDTTGGGPGPAVVRIPGADTPATVTPQGPQTNREWQNAAIRRLTDLGNDAGLCQRAIVKFLTGKTLTAQEAALVSEAIKLLGNPPEGAPELTVEGAPTSTTPPVSAPSDLTILSNEALINHGSAAVEASNQKEVDRTLAELHRRIRAGLSINDDGLWYFNGQRTPVAPPNSGPKPFTPVAMRHLLALGYRPA